MVVRSDYTGVGDWTSVQTLTWSDECRFLSSETVKDDEAMGSTAHDTTTQAWTWEDGRVVHTEYQAVDDEGVLSDIEVVVDHTFECP